MAFINFVAGTQLTEANLDTMFRQTVMSFASTAARDSALSGILVEGMLTYQTDTNGMTYYTGSAWRTVYLPLTSFTPTWSNVTLGNAGQTNFYSRHGDMVTAIYNFVFGSTTAFTGNVAASLPVAANTSIGYVHGSSMLHDVTGRRYGASCQLDTASQLVLPTFSNGTGGLVTATDPFTWATGDNLTFTIAYPAA